MRRQLPAPAVLVTKAGGLLGPGTVAADGCGAPGDGGRVDEVNVAVLAPIVGRDLSFVSDVDARVRVLDANFAAPGRWRVPGGQTEGDPDRLGAVLGQA